MFGGQGAANAIVPVFQAMRLLTELVPVQDGFSYPVACQALYFGGGRAFIGTPYLAALASSRLAACRNTRVFEMRTLLLLENAHDLRAKAHYFNRLLGLDRPRVARSARGRRHSDSAPARQLLNL